MKNALQTLDWIGLELLLGTGVATALRIVQWPTLFLTRPYFSFIHIVMAFISREKIRSEKVQHCAPFREVWRGQKLLGQCPQIRSAFQRGVSLRTALSGFNAERNFNNEFSPSG